MTNSALAVRPPPLLGDQRPRLLLAPPGASSHGAAAVQLAAAAGLFLDPWQQLVLEVWLTCTPDGRWAAYELGLIVARQQGKGSILEALELYKLFVLREPMILHTAHQYKTAMRHYKRIVSLVQQTPILATRVAAYPRNPSSHGIILRTGEELQVIARSKSSGRGYTANTVVADEAMEGLGEDEMSALQPTQNAIADPQFVYTGSAPLATSEQLHSVRSRALEGVERMAFLEWSAPDDCDLSDRRAWSMATPALGYRTSEQSIAASLAALPPGVFGREILSIPDELESSAQVIPAATWDQHADPNAHIDGPPTFAIDVSPIRSWSAIAVAGDARGRPMVEIPAETPDLVDHRPGTDWIVPRVVNLTKKYDARTVFLTGTAAESLRTDLEEAGLTVAALSGPELAQACGVFFDAAIQPAGGLLHPGQSQLDLALALARKNETDHGWSWGRRKSAGDITPLVAATVALWGHKIGRSNYDVQQSAW